ncbi:preprotein translocase subunit SecE [Vagococcus entomophilus]|uniref:Protein translocase subunit SecE n=1 Tax=Vagococcus entomophilus TaxID=1160095 RepID=A0A430AKR4_9ENTE|nr:preprotein translocase subunit SecE [Vagococcus entomophilus]
MKKIGNFIKSVNEEMKIVTWPSKKQLRKDVVVVIETTIIFAAFFAVADFAIKQALNLFL